ARAVEGHRHGAVFRRLKPIVMGALVAPAFIDVRATPLAPVVAICPRRSAVAAAAIAVARLPGAITRPTLALARALLPAIILRAIALPALAIGLAALVTFAAAIA